MTKSVEIQIDEGLLELFEAVCTVQGEAPRTVIQRLLLQYVLAHASANGVPSKKGDDADERQ